MIGDGMTKYRDNFWDDNKAIWALWIPCDVVIYAIPIWMRLPANHMISLVWTCILSFMRGDAIEDVQEEKGTFRGTTTAGGLAEIEENQLKNKLT